MSKVKRPRFTQDEFDRIKVLLDAGVSQKLAAKISGRSVPLVFLVNKSKTFVEYTELQREYNNKSNEKQKAKKLAEREEVILATPMETKAKELPSCPENDVLEKILVRLNDIENTQKALLSVQNEINDKLNLVAVPKRRFR